MVGALGVAAAVLLVWSGLAKLRTPMPVADLLVAPLAVRGLGLVEVAVGTWFLAAGTPASAAALAAGYLVFTAVTLRLATSRRSVPCGCFGRSDAPTGVVHVVVDAVAAAAALACVAWPPGPLGGFTDAEPTVAAVGLAQVLLLATLVRLLVTSLPELLADRALGGGPVVIVLLLIETVLLAVLAVLVAGLLRAHGTVLRRLHALDGGVGGDSGFALRAPVAPAAQPEQDPDAHDVTGETVDGELVTARVADVEHNTLLLFLSSGCDSCGAFWADLAGPVQLPIGTRLLVVAQDRDLESPSELARLTPAGVDVVLSSDAWRDYEVPGSPHAVFVDGPRGRVRGEGTGQSLRQVAELLAQSTGDTGFVVTPSIGKPGRDAHQELEVDRALLAAGILPGDPRLYGEDS